MRSRLHAIKEQDSTPLMVYRDKHPLGFLSVSDQVRSGADNTVECLKKLGLKQIGILSGDHEKSVVLVGVTRLWSWLKPDDKLRIIHEIHQQGTKVIFVGDDIAKLPFLISLSRRMLFIIKLNIAFGLVFNLFSVLAGASGLITPIMGAMVHNIDSVLVALSSASIGFFKEESL